MIRGQVDYAHTLKEQKIFIKLKNKILFIDKKNIKYILSSSHYVEVFTESRKYLMRNSISKMISHLNDSSFFRIHRSTIINSDFIEELIYSSYGEIDVKMKDEKLLRVSKSYKKDFLEKIGIK